MDVPEVGSPIPESVTEKTTEIGPTAQIPTPEEPTPTKEEGMVRC